MAIDTIEGGAGLLLDVCVQRAVIDGIPYKGKSNEHIMFEVIIDFLIHLTDPVNFRRDWLCID